MRLIISVVSHRHHNVIVNLETLSCLSRKEEVIVICRDNLPVNKLKRFCSKNQIHYLSNEKPLGFSRNNNLNYSYYREQIGSQKGDMFMLLNPDVMISEENIRKLLDKLKKINGRAIITANLFLDKEFVSQDDNIRLYPSFLDFIQTFLLNRRKTMIDRKKGLPVDKNYWCSGAFMVVDQETYLELGGLNQWFYLYCEDIEFCYRAKKKNIDVVFLEGVKAVHFRQRDSKQILSKYFVWHVYGVLCFHLCKAFPNLVSRGLIKK